MRRAGLIGLSLVALAAPAAARAASVPKGEQLEAKAFLASAGAPDLAYFPARLPAHFAFESYSVSGSPLNLDLSFRNLHFIANPDVMRVHEVSFDASYLAGGSCGAGAHGTAKIGGVTVYESAKKVWRCLRSARGHNVKVEASGPAPLSSLGILVAYARPG